MKKLNTLLRKFFGISIWHLMEVAVLCALALWASACNGYESAPADGACDEVEQALTEALNELDSMPEPVCEVNVTEVEALIVENEELLKQIEDLNSVTAGLYSRVKTLESQNSYLSQPVVCGK